MPLKVMDVVDQRVRLVLEVESGRLSAREAAAVFGVSKTQVYEWLARYRADGLDGVVPRSRRPHRSPGETSAEVEDAIVTLHKQRRGRWGAKKIRARLAMDGVAVPATSTVHAILIRRGLVVPAPRRRRDPGRRFAREYSNQLWQIDGTQHRLRNGRDFWVVDIEDDATRFLLAAVVGATLTGRLAWEALRGAVGRYGLPAQLLSDNGTTFTGRLHGFEVGFERSARSAGIDFIHARPDHPQTLGKDERQHGTQNGWIADHRPASLAEAQAVLDAYRDDYNTYRPHEAIGQRLPAEIYRPGTPLLLPALDELDPADDYPPQALIRRVDPHGRIRYRGHTLTINRRWAGVPVGLVHDGAKLHIFYGKAEIETLLVPHLNGAARPR
jgi:transposase InsO family protein